MKKKDFFISYHHKDRAWAVWIAWQLESDGYSVIIDSWDWGAGDNFILKMNEAAQLCERTIIVLSPDFLQSAFTQLEWSAALTRDPTGEKRLLIPVRVAECELQGFFNPIVYIDFYSIICEPPASDEDHKEQIRLLRHRLLQGITQHRHKPDREPPAPISRPSSRHTNHEFDRDALETYKNELIKDIKNIDLFHLKHLTGNIPFPIRKVYIPLKANPRDLTTGSSARDSLKDRALRYLDDEQKEPRELNELLTRLYQLPDCRAMLVLGKPGSGKTTLLKYLAYVYASEGQSALDPGLQTRLPFFIRLKDIAEHIGENSDHTASYEDADSPQGEMDLSQAIQTLYNQHHRKKPRLADGVEPWLHGALVLLDGLDEVATVKHRKAVADWVKRQVEDYEDTYFILSSRVHAYDPYYAPDNALTVEVDDFNESQRRQLLHNLFTHTHEHREQTINPPRWQPEALANRLVKHIESKDHLVDLARNPLLLSIIALLQIKHANDKPEEAADLPESRSELYAQCVQLFIDEHNWDYGRDVHAEVPGLDSKQYRKLLEHAALHLQCRQSERADESPSVDKQNLLDQLVKDLKFADRSAIAGCLEHSHKRTLLLVEQSLDQWGFQHKTFQEYLVAEAIWHNPDKHLDTLIKHMGLDHWAMVFHLFLEKLLLKPDDLSLLNRFLRDSGQMFAEDNTLAARAWLWLEALYRYDQFPYPQSEKIRLQQIAWHGLSKTQDPVALAKFHNFAALGLPAMELDSNKLLQRLQAVANDSLLFIHHVLLIPELLDSGVDTITNYLLNHLSTDSPNAVSGAVALALKYYGVRVSNIIEFEELERHLFVPILDSEFYRGSQEVKYDFMKGEIDGNRYNLPMFQISRYQVTNFEYQQFVQAKEYQQPRHWEKSEYPPGLTNHPVFNVSWDDAKAYTDWLNERNDGFTYSLPTESQWERAARGPAWVNGAENRRRYPWGDKFDPTKANVSETGLESTIAVGCFPAGASPEGVLDMAGNVWEWCTDWADNDYYRKCRVDENTIKGGGYKVVRGGSYPIYSGIAYCSYRGAHVPNQPSYKIGFRVARIPRS